VALAAWPSDALARWLAPGDPTLAGIVALASLAALAVLMGSAFPRLFAAGPGWLLTAANLLGSVVAAALVGNVVLPERGPSGAALAGALAYALAAVASAVAGRGAAPMAAGPASGPDRSALAAAAVAGAVTLGGEVLVLRRLPFFLEGFQPTLAGVLVAVLLVLAVGAALAGAVRSRHERAARLALALSAAALVVPFLERLGPALAAAQKASVVDTWTMHVRIWMVALVATLPLLPLGAVVPLLIATAPAGAARTSRAGWLWAAHGAGGLAGAMLASHAVPALAPGAFFVAAPAALAVLAALGAGRWAALALAPVCGLAAALGSTGAGTLAEPRPPLSGSRYDHPERYRYLAHETDSVLTASAVHDRGSYGLALFTDEFPAAYKSPDAGYMKALAHLPMLLHGAVESSCVICLGTGTTANALALWPGLVRLEAVEISRAVVRLADRFADDGPVPTGRKAPFSVDPRAKVHVTDGRRFLAQAPEASFDLVTMEPLLPYAPGTLALYTREFYALAKRALRDRGLFVQWVPTHALTAEAFSALLATFCAELDRPGIWLFDRATLLVGWKGAPRDWGPAELTERLARATPDLSVSLQECGIGSAVDVELALVARDAARLFGPDTEVLTDERPWLERLPFWSNPEKAAWLGKNLRLLEGFLEITRGPGEDEVLWLARRDRLASRRAVGELPLGLGTSVEAESSLVSGLRRAPQSLLLWQELRALREGSSGTRLEQLRGGRGAGARGVLEDLGRLPEGGELVAAARAGDPRGPAYRSAFRARVAAALIVALAKAPLPDADRRTLGAVCDPATLARASELVRARQGSLEREVLPLLAPDLPLLPELKRLGTGGPEQRVALAEALAGRTDAASREALADAMVDRELAVRTAAAASVYKTLGAGFSYDPAADEAVLRAAAERVRRLHNPFR
jgi:spermidine synthase